MIRFLFKTDMYVSGNQRSYACPCNTIKSQSRSNSTLFFLVQPNLYMSTRLIYWVIRVINFSISKFQWICDWSLRQHCRGERLLWSIASRKIPSFDLQTSLYLTTRWINTTTHGKRAPGRNSLLTVRVMESGSLPVCLPPPICLPATPSPPLVPALGTESPTKSETKHIVCVFVLHQFLLNRQRSAHLPRVYGCSNTITDMRSVRPGKYKEKETPLIQTFYIETWTTCPERKMSSKKIWIRLCHRFGVIFPPSTRGLIMVQLVSWN